MRFMLSVCLLIYFFIGIDHAKAVNITLDGMSPNSIAAYELVGGESLQLELEIINDSSVTRLLSLGQVNLQLVPNGIANGVLQLSGSPSSTPFFTGVLGSIANGDGSLSLSAAPAFPVFEQPIDSGNRGTLVDLSINSQSDTVGTFNLVASPLNVLDLSLSSHWLEAGTIGFQPFSNNNTNESDQIILATIMVNPIPEPSSLTLFCLTSLGYKSRKRLF